MGDKEIVNNYFRKYGVSIGIGANICSNVITPESYLIKIGNNVTIAYDVHFITHDNSISKLMPEMTDLFGEIVIGDNCFIGACSTIMYGVELKSNTIVAAGSVVTKSFNESNVIIGGNPAQIIGTWDNYLAKISKYALNVDNLSSAEKKQKILSSNLIRR
jgi:acetyltransferase-like isoleucine patch superfamily enzyme